MPRGTIRFDDRTGKLMPGKVWLMDFGEVDLDDRTAYAMMTYQEGIGRSREIKDCALDKRHVTCIERLSLGVDLHGDRLGDFVPVIDDFEPVISAAFATRLRQSPLTGYKIRPIVKIIDNESQIAKPELFYLEFAGQGGRSEHLVVEGAPNLCPHCGKTPMVCPACGYTNWSKCIVCDEWTLFLPKEPDYSHPKGFLIQGYPPDVHIVDAKSWDGSDFFMAGGKGGVPFVSNRAKEWMERTHTFPVKFKPALLNIAGVEEKFQGK